MVDRVSSVSMVHNYEYGMIWEYRVNNPMTWYDSLSKDAGGSIVEGKQSRNVKPKEGTTFYPIAKLLDPTVLDMRSADSNYMGPSVFQCSSEDSHTPLDMKPSFSIIPEKDELPEPGASVLAEVTAQSQSTTTIANGSVTFDLASILTEVVQIGHNQRLSGPYGLKFTSVFAGVVKPVIKDKFTAKASWSLKHHTPPDSIYDGITFSFSVRLQYLNLYQIFRHLTPTAEKGRNLSLESLTTPHNVPLTPGTPSEQDEWERPYWYESPPPCSWSPGTSANGSTHK